MSWPGQGDQNWGQPGSYGGDENPYPLPGQGPYSPPGQAPPQVPGPPPQGQYSLPGGPGGPPPPSGGGGGALTIVLVLLAVLTLVVAVVGGVVILSRSDHETGPNVSSGPPEARSSASESPEASHNAATVAPRIGGWQGVGSYKHGLAYDVPRSWQVKSPSTIVGFEDDKGNPLVGMSGAAGVDRGDCTLIRAGVSGGKAPDTSRSAKVSDLPGTAQYAAQRWANAGYTPKNGPKPTLRLSSPASVTRSGIRGYHVTASVTVNGTRGTCDPPQAVVHAVAFPSTEGDPVVFIVYADRGVPGAVGDQDISRAISSIRQLH